MATTFELVVATEPTRAERARTILFQAHAEIQRLENELSEYRAESPVYLLNHARPGETIRFPRDAMVLLLRSLQISRLTQGAFDVTVKSQACAVPAPARLDINYERGEVSRTHAGVHLGFGAIGKGFALDRIRLLLESEGFTDFLLSAGGSSIVLSGYASPQGDPWRWGWSWKRDEAGESLGLPIVHASGTSVSLGISGLHEKGEHLFSPLTGSQLEQTRSPRSALVADRSAADADALSTALFVAGWDRGLQMLNELPASAPGLAMIDSDETPRWNGIFEGLWKFSALLSTLALGFSSTAAHAQETIDLGAMTTESFTPYLFERDDWWMLLPALMIVFVLLHLKKYRPAARRKAVNPFHKL